MFRSSRCPIALRTLRRRSAPWGRAYDFRRRADGAARVLAADPVGREGNGPSYCDRDIGLSSATSRRQILVSARPGAARYQELVIRKPIARRRDAISRRRCVLPSGWPRSASRYGCVSRWCPASPMIPPMSKDREVRRADEERRVGGGAAVPPAWRLQMEGDGLNYKHADTLPPSPELVARVIGQFGLAGCNAR